MLKRCSYCETPKPLESFHRSAEMKGGLHSHCKDCRRILNTTNKYGISREDLLSLIKKQNGLCAICKTAATFSSRKLSVDHDHRTGQVRALLCNHCNVGLGAFRDDVELMQKAIRYLKKFTTRAN